MSTERAMIRPYNSVETGHFGAPASKQPRVFSMSLDLSREGGLAVTGIALMQLGGNGGASRRRFPSRCIRRMLMSFVGVQGLGLEVA